MNSGSVISEPEMHILFAFLACLWSYLSCSSGVKLRTNGDFSTAATLTGYVPVTRAAEAQFVGVQTLFHASTNAVTAIKRTLAANERSSFSSISFNSLRNRSVNFF